MAWYCSVSLTRGNGVAGTVALIERHGAAPTFLVELDDANERNEKLVSIPASFARFDWALCRTNHSSQGRTFDSAHVLVNPSMCDREWSYVAASRSRFSTTIYVNSSLLGLVDPESHRESDSAPKTRAAAIDALASRMARSRAKGTSLDYDEAPDVARDDPSMAPKRLHGESRGAEPLRKGIGIGLISAISRIRAASEAAVWLVSKRAEAAQAGQEHRP